MRIIYRIVRAIVLSTLATMVLLAPALAGSVGTPFADVFNFSIFDGSQNIAVLNNGVLVNVGYDGTSAANTSNNFCLILAESLV